MRLYCVILDDLKMKLFGGESKKKEKKIHLYILIIFADFILNSVRFMRIWLNNHPGVEMSPTEAAVSPTEGRLKRCLTYIIMHNWQHKQKRDHCERAKAGICRRQQPSLCPQGSSCDIFPLRFMLIGLGYYRPSRCGAGVARISSGLRQIW